MLSTSRKPLACKVCKRTPKQYPNTEYIAYCDACIQKLENDLDTWRRELLNDLESCDVYDVADYCENANRDLRGILSHYHIKDSLQLEEILNQK